MKTEYIEIGTIDGVIVEINYNGKTNTCILYNDTWDDNFIKCKFPKNLFKNITDALNRDVFVTGELFYKSNENVPYKIDIQEIEILPPKEALPSLSDLKGIAPNITGDKTPEEFVREFRDEWDG